MVFDHLKTWHFGLVLEWYSKTRPFHHQPHFEHSKYGHLWYSDYHLDGNISSVQIVTEIILKIPRSLLENLQRRQENDATESRHFRHRQKVIRHEIAELKSSWKGLHVGPVQEGHLAAHPVKTSSNPDCTASSGGIQGLPGFCHGAGNTHSWFKFKTIIIWSRIHTE